MRSRASVSTTPLLIFGESHQVRIAMRQRQPQKRAFRELRRALRLNQLMSAAPGWQPAYLEEHAKKEQFGSFGRASSV
jgi:hypothetical protein